MLRCSSGNNGLVRGLIVPRQFTAHLQTHRLFDVEIIEQSDLNSIYSTKSQIASRVSVELEYLAAARARGGANCLNTEIECLLSVFSCSISPEHTDCLLLEIMINLI